MATSSTHDLARSRRLRAATITLFVAAFGFSSLTLGGSTHTQHHSAPTPSIQSR